MGTEGGARTNEQVLQCPIRGRIFREELSSLPIAFHLILSPTCKAKVSALLPTLQASNYRCLCEKCLLAQPSGSLLVLLGLSPQCLNSAQGFTGRGRKTQ